MTKFEEIKLPLEIFPHFKEKKGLEGMYPHINFDNILKFFNLFCRNPITELTINIICRLNAYRNRNQLCPIHSTYEYRTTVYFP